MNDPLALEQLYRRTTLADDRLGIERPGGGGLHEPKRDEPA
jgi:hypothetical protein